MILSKNIILITAGDPASISSEITIKAIETKKISENINAIVVTDPNLIEECKFYFEKELDSSERSSYLITIEKHIKETIDRLRKTIDENKVSSLVEMVKLLDN